MQAKLTSTSSKRCNSYPNDKCSLQFSVKRWVNGFCKNNCLVQVSQGGAPVFRGLAGGCAVRLRRGRAARVTQGARKTDRFSVGPSSFPRCTACCALLFSLSSMFESRCTAFSCTCHLNCNSTSIFHYCQTEFTYFISGKCLSSVKHNKGLMFWIWGFFFFPLMYLGLSVDWWLQQFPENRPGVGPRCESLGCAQTAISRLAFSGYASTVCSGQQPRCTNASETGRKNRLEQACYPGNRACCLTNKAGYSSIGKA